MKLSCFVFCISTTTAFFLIAQTQKEKIKELTSQLTDTSAHLGSVLETASSCFNELRDTQRTLEATQSVCREEVAERQKKCEAGLCQ